MALLPLRVFAYSSCGEFYETKRLAQLDLLSARIPQRGVNGAFNNLKKIREMFWSGRPDLNRGPPAPKAGALPGCATPRQTNPSILLYYLGLSVNKTSGAPIRQAHPSIQKQSRKLRNEACCRST